MDLFTFLQLIAKWHLSNKGEGEIADNFTETSLQKFQTARFTALHYIRSKDCDVKCVTSEWR